MTRYDIAIIGTGPAGLEAAITAKVRNKNILLLGGKSEPESGKSAYDSELSGTSGGVGRRDAEGVSETFGADAD